VSRRRSRPPSGERGGSVSALGGAGAVVAVALLAASILAARGGGFEDRTASVVVGDDTTTFELDSCGLERSTVFVVGRADGGRILQLVVSLEDDGATGIPDSTGFSVDAADGTELAAFGAEAWSRRGMTGAPPGEVVGARVEGSRIQVSARAVEVDPSGRPRPGGADATVSLDARCDLDES
jgi:hypothetical protein